MCTSTDVVVVALLKSHTHKQLERFPGTYTILNGKNGTMPVDVGLVTA